MLNDRNFAHLNQLVALRFCQRMCRL
jgi:hypothetical protein